MFHGHPYLNFIYGELAGEGLSVEPSAAGSSQHEVSRIKHGNIYRLHPQRGDSTSPCQRHNWPETCTVPVVILIAD